MNEKNVVELARRLADALNDDPVDPGSAATVRDVLDWLASAGLTLEPSSDDSVSEAYSLDLQEDSLDDGDPCTTRATPRRSVRSCWTGTLT